MLPVLCCTSFIKSAVGIKHESKIEKLSSSEKWCLERAILMKVIFQSLSFLFAEQRNNHL